jgi:hypothetical protein
MTYTPRFVTETDQPSPWLDCCWSSAVMLGEKATLGQIPGTSAEREALRADSGDKEGGSNFGNVDVATRKRYGWTFARCGNWNELLHLLANGYGAHLNLNMHYMPDLYNRFDPGFARRPDAYHSVYAERYDPVHERVWWQNPLGRGSYTGEWVPTALLRAAMLPMGAILSQVVAEGVHRKESTVLADTYTSATVFAGPRRWVVRAGVRLLGYKWNPLTGAFSVAVDRTFAEDSSALADAQVVIAQKPDATVVPHGTFLRVSNGSYAGLLVSAGKVELQTAPPPADVAALIRERDGFRDVAQQRGLQLDLDKKAAAEAIAANQRITGEH